MFSASRRLRRTRNGTGSHSEQSAQDFVADVGRQVVSNFRRLGRAKSGNRPFLPLASSISQGADARTNRTEKPDLQQSRSSPSLDIRSPQHIIDQKNKSKVEEERILIGEIDVAGVDGPLRETVFRVLKTRPNFAYTVREVQEDIQRVFDTGYFSSCRPKAEDTRDGVRLTVEVVPNPTLQGVVARGGVRLPQAVVQNAFSEMAGKPLNFNDLTEAVATLNNWYQDHGVLGQVIDVGMGQGDVATIKLAEATVNRITLRYIDPKSGEPREEGKTKPEVILRQVTTRPGRAYDLRQAKSDMAAVYSMGLFEDVSIRPVPAEGSSMESPQVDLVLEVKERKKTGGLAAGGGISAAGTSEGSLPGFVGTVSYSQRNLFGLGQRLVASAEVGQADSTFRIVHTDPWVRGDAFRTSRTMSAQNTKTSAIAIHGRAPDEEAREGTGPPEGTFVARTTASVEYGRPLGSGWQGSLGLSWQRSRCVDERNNPLIQDCYGGPLMVNHREGGEARGYDTMLLGTMRVAYHGAQSGESDVVASMEQAVPVQRDWLNFNRFTLRVDRAFPLIPGLVKVWVSGKGGAIVGDLPPYEAFPIGGTNSVRGYAEGGVGTGRNYIASTAEVRFPLVAPLEGCMFADYGTDLGSGSSVPGDPAGCRQKPGKGYGVGVGLRIETPIGPLRLEYAVNDVKQRRFHLGIGSYG